MKVEFKSHQVQNGTGMIATATIDAIVDGERKIEIANGLDEIDALCKVIDKAVGYGITTNKVTTESLRNGDGPKSSAEIVLELSGHKFYGKGEAVSVSQSVVKAYEDALKSIYPLPI